LSHEEEYFNKVRIVNSSLNFKGQKTQVKKGKAKKGGKVSFANKGKAF
jgi:hypothetical protein